MDSLQEKDPGSAKPAFSFLSASSSNTAVPSGSVGGGSNSIFSTTTSSSSTPAPTFLFGQASNTVSSSAFGNPSDSSTSQSFGFSQESKPPTTTSSTSTPVPFLFGTVPTTNSTANTGFSFAARTTTAAPTGMLQTWRHYVHASNATVQVLKMAAHLLHLPSAAAFHHLSCLPHTASKCLHCMLPVSFSACTTTITVVSNLRNLSSSSSFVFGSGSSAPPTGPAFGASQTPAFRQGQGSSQSPVLTFGSLSSSSLFPTGSQAGPPTFGSVSSSTQPPIFGQQASQQPGFGSGTAPNSGGVFQFGSSTANFNFTGNNPGVFTFGATPGVNPAQPAGSSAFSFTQPSSFNLGNNGKNIFSVPGSSVPGRKIKTAVRQLVAGRILRAKLLRIQQFFFSDLAWSGYSYKYSLHSEWLRIIPLFAPLCTLICVY
ncbi:hypothetical protein EYD10_08729 [Varanus komodoensis]|nr:hypothetical protein EYD10_08729 [Varanus komodoensis]